MKTHIFLIALTGLVLINVQGIAQSETEIKNSDVKGFYISLCDFKNEKITITTDKVHKGDKIKLKQFFISPNIISIEQDEETVYYKDSIFAVQLTNGKNYRFIRKMPCLIADTSYLYIYTYQTSYTIYDLTGPRRRSKEIPVTYYYFSNNNQSKVYLLNLSNLENVALSDSSVYAEVCNKFTSDEMLTQINQQTGRFELNETILSLLNKH